MSTEASQATQGASRPAADGKLVLAFGDSLYAGYGVLPQQSFPARLERVLAAQGIAATVTNAGVSGDTTGAARRRLSFVLDGLARKPDLAMVNLGGNDMLRGIDPAETRANLTAICEELKRRGIPILLTGMVAAPNMGADYAGKFNPIYADLAKRYDAALYPFFLGGVVTRPELMQPDRVHPTPAGIDTIVGKVAPLVAKTLKSQ
ncbi:acyl-CoA thioesterase-1 [Novosphingobium chloroacetimidivorans]|uniref:Acyl-CoA thioesterase-1 n=1 Tax=Novosphingobium chloroacetimidivorans TaxID=1428314 RepID=A0A7W7NYI9_9SPHN|nr:arylesterase [Novosphingobium chloroacetimidivorans]MBB4860509.1 acyl-CoA thioesterase-1 [Novosphingobium chloroacetimidivorans]